MRACVRVRACVRAACERARQCVPRACVCCACVCSVCVRACVPTRRDGEGGGGGGGTEREGAIISNNLRTLLSGHDGVLWVKRRSARSIIVTKDSHQKHFSKEKLAFL